MLSIIIPFFNTSTRIYPCLESLITLHKFNRNTFEVIFVNDGSTDDTDEIISTFLAGLDPKINFKIIKKSNGGVSSARNYGLNVAQGDYIIFLDSDDALLNFDILNTIKPLSTNQVDLLIFNYIVYNNNIQHNNYVAIDDSCKKPDINFIDNYISGYYVNMISVCSIIYNKKSLSSNKIIFNEKLSYGEDQLFVFSCLEKLKYYYYNTPILAYIKDTRFSAMGKYSIKRFDVIYLYNTFKLYSHNMKTIATIEDRIDFELLIISKLFFISHSTLESISFYKNKVKPLLHLGRTDKKSRELKLLIKYPYFYIMLYKIYRKVK